MLLFADFEGVTGLRTRQDLLAVNWTWLSLFSFLYYQLVVLLQQGANAFDDYQDIATVCLGRFYLASCLWVEFPSWNR